MAPSTPESKRATRGRTPRAPAIRARLDGRAARACNAPEALSWIAASLLSRLCRAAGGASCAELAEELGGVETAAEAAPVEEQEEEEEVVVETEDGRVSRATSGGIPPSSATSF